VYLRYSVSPLGRRQHRRERQRNSNVTILKPKESSQIRARSVRTLCSDRASIWASARSRANKFAGAAKGVFTHSQSSCHIAKVVLAFTAAKSPQRLTRHLATPPAVSSIGGLRTPAPVCAAPHSWGRHPQTFTNPEIERLHEFQTKAAGRRLFNSNLMIVHQVAISAALFFRRYAMKPRPAKPRIIITHVEGSGTPLRRLKT